MGCPGQARTKPRTQNSRRNAATGTPDGGRTAAPAARAACGSYSAGVRRLQCRRAAAIVPACRRLQCLRAAATVPACGRYSACVRQLQCRRPRSEARVLRQSALEDLTNSPRTESPRHADRNKSNHVITGGGRRAMVRRRTATAQEVAVGRIQLAVGPQPLRLRNHNLGLAQRIMVKRLATLPHDPLGITDSACKNQFVVVSIQYGPFNTYIPIRSTTIGKSRVARDPITMHTSWRSNSDITSVTRQTHLPKTHPILWSEIYYTIISSDSIGYPRMKASGESSTTKHRLLHASGPHPIPPPNDPNMVMMITSGTEFNPDFEYLNEELHDIFHNEKRKL
ncbi:hypothetical protein F511_39775 [Dorcoceras hygrometricum]|uniref:Uncharacterized protein n=1 Tax=Dorcoceras hygrometricum TaxID=472368 RepID=A0A2Z7B050_9LAMI|nr:hypothetical protein F511_39775 [Dorcoceras hygrometricum]